MKKWIALLLALVMCLSLCACGSKRDDADDDDDERDEQVEETAEPAITTESQAISAVKNDGYSDYNITAQAIARKLGFNQFLALFKHAKPMKDDSYGWFVGDEYSDYNWSYYKGVPWIDIQPQIVSTPEGETILQMAYGMWPYPEYLTTDDNPDIHLSEYYINKRSDAK